MNNRIKKGIAIILVLTFLLSICGCTSNRKRRTVLFDTAYGALKNDNMEIFSYAVVEMYSSEHFPNVPTSVNKVEIPEGYDEHLFYVLLYLEQFVLDDSNEDLRTVFPLIYETIIQYDPDCQKSFILLNVIFSDTQEILSKDKMERLVDLLEEQRKLLPNPEEINDPDTLKSSLKQIRLSMGLSDLQATCYRYSGNTELSEEIFNHSIEISKKLTQIIMQNTQESTENPSG